MVKRLFDIVAERSREEPDATMLAAKENGTWRNYTCRDIWNAAVQLSHGLIQSGIPNDLENPETQAKIAVVSHNRPEWIITDVGVQLTGAVLTPIYPTISPNEFVFVLNEAKVHTLFVENGELFHRFSPVFPEIPTLHNIYSFEEIEGATFWKEICSSPAGLQPPDTTQITANTLATLIYTSGTTGKPKGVMLSHYNIVENIKDCLPEFSFAQKGDKALSFLPLNHIFERTLTYIYIQAGVAVHYAESLETIGENLKEVQPIVFTTVPRLLEKVYEKILLTGLALSVIKKKIFFWALGLAHRYDNQHRGSFWYRFQLILADKLVFRKWREALGGKVKAIVSGSAALQERLARVFTAAGIVVMEGYGLTETSPVVSVNKYNSEDRRIGTIGPPIRNVQVKLAADGEILVKGANIMMGYYKNPKLTADVLKDGWFHTGDIGEWVEGRFLKITDRKKEMFKTSGGKYVAPQLIENTMKESLYIEQIMVLGANRKFVGALVVPAFKHVQNWLQEQGENEPDTRKLIRIPKVRDLFRKEIDRLNKRFGHIEQIKRFQLIPEEWTVDKNELTPSLKIRRNVIEERYQNYIDQIYQNSESPLYPN